MRIRVAGPDDFDARFALFEAVAGEGRWIGSALMAAAVDWARGQGVHKLTLQLWPYNVAARRL